MIQKISLISLNTKITKKLKNILFGNCCIMINKNHRSFICGIKGFKLTKSEAKFIEKYKPWGIILFSRNIKSIKQTQLLTSSIKKILKKEINELQKILDKL